jgi:hypothetical protein
MAPGSTDAGWTPHLGSSPLSWGGWGYRVTARLTGFRIPIIRFHIAFCLGRLVRAREHPGPARVRLLKHGQPCGNDWHWRSIFRSGAAVSHYAIFHDLRYTVYILRSQVHCDQTRMALWVYFPHYRLNEQIVNRFLTDTFGARDFHTQVCSLPTALFQV